jgi:hypothetical protein
MFLYKISINTDATIPTYSGKPHNISDSETRDGKQRDCPNNGSVSWMENLVNKLDNHSANPDVDIISIIPA